MISHFRRNSTLNEWVGSLGWRSKFLIKLTYKKYLETFNFSNLHFDEIRQTKFRYRMDGQD